MLNPLTLALALAAGLAAGGAVWGSMRCADTARKVRRYRAGLERIAKMSIHAVPGSVFSTEAEWAKAVATEALYPPSLKPRMPKAIEELEKVRRR